MIDNKTINCVTLPMLKAYPVSSLVRSKLYTKQSKWLLIPNTQKCSSSDLSQNCLQNCDQSINMALVNGGYFHYTNMKLLVRF